MMKEHRSPWRNREPLRSSIAPLLLPWLLGLVVSATGCDRLWANFPGRICAEADKTVCWQVNIPGNPALFAIWGDNTGELWVGGEHGVVLRWNGKLFETVASDCAQGRDIQDIWGSGGKDIWFVGRQRLVMRWNGEQMSCEREQLFPTVMGFTVSEEDELDQIWGTTTTDVRIAVNRSGHGASIWRWDGSSWSLDTITSTGKLTGLWASQGTWWTVGDQDLIMTASGTPSSWSTYQFDGQRPSMDMGMGTEVFNALAVFGDPASGMKPVVAGAVGMEGRIYSLDTTKMLKWQEIKPAPSDSTVVGPLYGLWVGGTTMQGKPEIWAVGRANRTPNEPAVYRVRDGVTLERDREGADGDSRLADRAFFGVWGTDWDTDKGFRQELWAVGSNGVIQRRPRKQD